MNLTDTHCHIHSDDYPLNPEEVIVNAKKDGVTKLLCVGTSLEDSKKAIGFVETRPDTWATIGIHPHDSKHYTANSNLMDEFKSLANKSKVVAVGECGLDYFYEHSPKKDQITILEEQLQLAKDNNLPLIFHVRDAFDDFWPIFDNFKGLNGVIHSFTANVEVLNQILSRNLYVGLNGIVTFSKSADQNYAAAQVPLGSMLLETDSPFLTPAPKRGQPCEPKYLKLTAEFIARTRGIGFDDVYDATTNNATKLFNLENK